MADLHDVVIVGAGPGGAAAAHYLAGQGLDVLLLDKADFPRDKTCGDGLTPRALDVLDDMGVLPDLLRSGYRVDEVTVVAPRGHSVSARVPERSGRPDYALIVPRQILDRTIVDRAVTSGARFQGRVRVTDIEQETDAAVVKGERLGTTFSVRARVVVIATGAAATRLLRRIGLLTVEPRMMLAARTYVEGLNLPASTAYFRFDGVPLPGYGWIFPISPSAANVGVGFLASQSARGHNPLSPLRALDHFMRNPRLRPMFAEARLTAPVKGYPLRSDFGTAPVSGRRLLLVGEAAGLVNPLTGEGIDYALESGRLAAQFLGERLSTGDLSPAEMEAYDRLLQERFQALFLFSRRVRDLCLNRSLLNFLVGVAARRPDLNLLLVRIVLGYQDISSGVTPMKILKAALAV